MHIYFTFSCISIVPIADTVEGYPFLFTVINSLHPADTQTKLWPQETEFQRSFYTKQYAYDANFKLFKQSIGSILAQSLTRKLKDDYEAIMQVYRYLYKTILVILEIHFLSMFKHQRLTFVKQFAHQTVF